MVCMSTFCVVNVLLESYIICAELRMADLDDVVLNNKRNTGTDYSAQKGR